MDLFPSNVPKHFKALLLLIAFSSLVVAQKSLVYDPEKGIVFTDEAKQAGSTPVVKREIISESSSGSNTVKTKPEIQKTSKKDDIHLNRKKDPPEVYFKSGLEYFKNNDLENAFKNFSYADSVSVNPLYKLWIAKTLRRMNNTGPMLKILSEITTRYESTDVADDALLEMAMYHKGVNNYEKALNKLTQLIEQYPFGISASTGEDLPTIAREQRRLIRQEMINTLAILGCQADDLTSSFKKFQKECGLSITGTGTIETVQRIKLEHQQLIKELQRQEDEKLQFTKYQWIMAISVAVVFGTFISLVAFNFAVRTRKRQLLELQNALIELDTRKI